MQYLAKIFSFYLNFHAIWLSVINLIFQIVSTKERLLRQIKLSIKLIYIIILLNQFHQTKKCLKEQNFRKTIILYGIFNILCLKLDHKFCCDTSFASTLNVSSIHLSHPGFLSLRIGLMGLNIVHNG